MEIKDDPKLYSSLKIKNKGSILISDKIARRWICDTIGCKGWQMSAYKMILLGYPISCSCISNKPLKLEIILPNDNITKISQIIKPLKCTKCYPCNKACEHYNIKLLYPELMEEWDFNLNKNILAENLTPYSEKIVSWKCKTIKCCHKWNGTIHSRIRNDGSILKNCPHCLKGTVCSHYNLKTKYPELYNQWDFERNENILPETVNFKSTIQIWWKCTDPRIFSCHRWTNSLKERLKSDGTILECPNCKNKIVCPHYNLKILYPDLIKEWDFIKNNINPETINQCDKYRAFWICKNFPEYHKWSTRVDHRTRSNSQCPYCTHGKASPIYNLGLLYPHLIPEWDITNGDITKVSPKSGKYFLWNCINGHQWKTRVVARTLHGSNCNKCQPAKYSKMQINWLNSIMKNEKIFILHAENGGEYYINNKIGHVDGFCKEKNTVYEFHGDYWHGNPLIHHHDDINSTNGKKYGELYNKTVIKSNKIRSKGYYLIEMWESDFLKQHTEYNYNSINKNIKEIVPHNNVNF